jgi:Uma2 family endonuclease
MTADEYLRWERTQEERHEYWHGEVFSMAGGSPRHAALIAAVTAELVIAHRGGPCKTLSTEMRTLADVGKHYVYPDASVVCGKLQLAPGLNDVCVNPSVVVEVLSSSTEAYDRGKKWDGYQKIASLTDYLLLSQSEVLVEHFQRDERGEWRYRSYREGARVTLRTGATLDVDTIYQGVFELKGE